MGKRIPLARSVLLGIRSSEWHSCLRDVSIHKESTFTASLTSIHRSCEAQHDLFGLAVDSALLNHLEQALDGVVVVTRFGAWLREELSDTMLAFLVGDEFFAEDDGIQFLFLLWVIGWNSLEVDRSLPQCLDQVIWLALTTAIVGSTVACCHCIVLVSVVI